MWKTPKAKTTSETSVFKRLEVLGAYQTGSRLRSARFDSMQHGIVKTCLASLERWGGRAMAPLSLLQVHTQRKTRWPPMGHFYKL